MQQEFRIGLFYKPKDSEHTSLKYSQAPVSHKNIPATILKSANIQYENYGRAVDEIGEKEDITRYYHKSIWFESNSQIKEKYGIEEDRLHTYEIRGDASNFSNWKLIGDDKLTYRY